MKKIVLLRSFILFIGLFFNTAVYSSEPSLEKGIWKILRTNERVSFFHVTLSNKEVYVIAETHYSKEAEDAYDTIVKEISSQPQAWYLVIEGRKFDSLKNLFKDSIVQSIPGGHDVYSELINSQKINKDNFVLMKSLSILCDLKKNYPSHAKKEGLIPFVSNLASTLIPFQTNITFDSKIIESQLPGIIENRKTLESHIQKFNEIYSFAQKYTDDKQSSAVKEALQTDKKYIFVLIGRNHLPAHISFEKLEMLFKDSEFGLPEYILDTKEKRLLEINDFNWLFEVQN